MEQRQEELRPLIRVRQLKKIYRPQVEDQESVGVQALAGIDLEILRGEFVAVMGPSGSGKSTLMQILGLLDRSSSGEFILDGTDVSGLNDDEMAALRCRKIGFIFQFFNLLPRTTCVDNVGLPMLYAGVADPDSRSKSLLERVGLGTRFFHRPHQLSGGQQQRVAIARALANEPQLIFADEPTGNVSTEQANEILAMLEELNSRGATIVVVTHEPEVAHKARRLITVRDGKVASDQLLRERTPPGLSSSAETVGALPSVRQKKDTLKQLWAQCRESFRMAWVALMLNKLRTTLATLGVVIGIASVVTMVAVGTGAQMAISEQLSSLGTNILFVRPITTGAAKGTSTVYRSFPFEVLDSLRSYSRSNPSIASVDGQVYGNIQIAHGSRNAPSNLMGAYPSNERSENNFPVAGRFFTEDENEGRARVAVIGQTVVRNLFEEGENPIGATIKVNRIDFTVIGVLPPKGATSFKDRDDQIIVPLYTAMQRVLGRKTLQSLVVEVADASLIPAVIEDVTPVLRRFRKVPEYQENDFEIRNVNEIQEIYSRTTGIISSMLASIAAVSLLVGGIGIMNVMLVAVKERTREVGLRKAIGARNRDILLQFLIESILIGIFGGCLGILTGYALSSGISTFFEWPTVVPVHTVFLAFFFSVAVGIIFGLWPAKQASELSPIEALRYE